MITKAIVILSIITAYVDASAFLVYNYTYTLQDDNHRYDFEVTDYFNDILIKRLKLNSETGRPELRNEPPTWFNETKIRYYPKNNYNFMFWLNRMSETLDEINKLPETSNPYKTMSLTIGCTDLRQLQVNFGYVTVGGNIWTRFDPKNKRFSKVRSRTFPKVGMLTVKSQHWERVMEHLGSMVTLTCPFTADDYYKISKGYIDKPVKPTVTVTGIERGDNTTLICTFDNHYPSSVAVKWYNIEDFAPDYRYDPYVNELLPDTDYLPGEPGYPTITRRLGDKYLFTSSPRVMVPTIMSNRIACVGFHSTLEPSIYRCVNCSGPEPVLQYQGDRRNDLEDEED
ncbi:SPV148 MHC class I alpha chain-like protein P32231 [Swinepox virus]|uniref:Putative Ig-like domain-containing protein C1 n=2 Tax=Swinepox virus TaxID=10276 RepID=VC01_SWPVK|nr:MHC-like TNF binding protein [Swinepox virus]NP_570308.1 MHC-like TNF binding protein [Swinepox virus]P32231.1 RecName: Full=Putative Ig-like domain-containing protein C1 [Swinepox virus (STRAIN KASZA)]AAC37870.1 ORF C1L [Swinepox virus]AAC37871.1 K4R [Swinepox virus]AAL69742.1 SPV003 MHC class I alpha chain-like protein P32231 [Swinepox virus]AAL69887.1 SPV148 MHC class I alpha chain-like protein P32231 [Swinepox virus]UED36583.1 MHC-like TNF binding protein [Swinepox virus]